MGPGLPQTFYPHAREVAAFTVSPGKKLDDDDDLNISGGVAVGCLASLRQPSAVPVPVAPLAAKPPAEASRTADRPPKAAGRRTAKPQGGGAGGGAAAAAGSSAGGGPSSEGPRIRGRPKKDARTRAQELLSEYAASGEIDRAWFGDQHKNHDRGLTRCLADLKELMAPEESPDAFAAMEVLHKQLTAAQAVCKAFKQHGPSSRGMYVVFEQMEKFLAMCPVASCPHPRFLRQQMHEVGAQEAWPANLFWKTAGLAALKEAQYTTPEDKQACIVTEKVMVLSQRESLDTVKAGLLELTDPDTLAGAAAELAPSVQEGLKELRTIVAAGGIQLPDNDSLESALASGFDAVTALASYPKGRMLMDIARDHSHALQVARAEADRIIGMLASLVQAPIQVGVKEASSAVSSFVKAVDVVGNLASKVVSNALGSWGYCALFKAFVASWQQWMSEKNLTREGVEGTCNTFEVVLGLVFRRFDGLSAE